MLGAAIAWSAGGLGVKLVDAPALAIAGFRSLFAALVLGAAFVIYARRAGVHMQWALARLLRRPLLWGASAGYALMVVSFCVATKLTTAANAILLQYTAPIYVALLSWPLLRERVRLWDWFAIAGCVAGMVLFFRDQVSSSARVGDFVAILSSFGFAALPLQLRLDQRRLEEGAKDNARLVGLAPLFACLLGNVVAVVVCAPWMVREPPSTAAGWAVLVPLGMVQIGLAYVFYGAGVRRLRAVESTLVCTLEPILSPLWVLLGTGERPSSSAIAGGALIVVAVTVQAVAANATQRRSS
ncbi:MAG: EamA family transporter [Polyangiaceae bacterium]|nr:EamA family transporter [Polyangiaceae bacterium]